MLCEAVGDEVRNEGIKVIPSSALDTNTAQTPGMNRAAAKTPKGPWARIGRLESVMAARKLNHIRNIDAAELARRSGATSTSSLISNDFGGDQASCSRQVRAAKNLRVATLTEKALQAGEITFEKAEVIDAVRELLRRLESE